MGKSTTTPQPDTTISEINSQIATATADRDTALATVNRLGSIIEAAQTADQDLQHAVNADGGKTLGAYAAGEESPALAQLVEAQARTAKAAAAAQRAIPGARQALEQAEARITELNERKRLALSDALISLGNETAKKYADAVNNLLDCAASLEGLSSAMLTIDPLRKISFTSWEVDVPRFDFPVLRPHDGTHQAFMKCWPKPDKIHSYAASWSQMAERLSAGGVS